MLRIMFYWGITEDFSLDTASWVGLRTVLKGKEEPGYVGAFAKQASKQKCPRSPNIRLLPTKENQISQINEFFTFLSVGRGKESGPAALTPVVSPLPGRAVPCCFSILSPSGCPVGVADGLMA